MDLFAALAEPCNEACFKEFTSGLLRSGNPREQDAQCVRVGQVAPNVMYSLACRVVLSDLPEHRKRRAHSYREYCGDGQLSREFRNTQ